MLNNFGKGKEIQLFHFSNILLLLTLHQSLFITLQIKKSLQNKIFQFSIPNILTFLLFQKKHSYFFSYQSIFATISNRNEIVYQTNPKFTRNKYTKKYVLWKPQREDNRREKAS
jgi:hypothetical protein